MDPEPQYMFSNITSRAATSIFRGFHRIRNHFLWSRIPCAQMINEVDLHNYGGSRLALSDLNGDGRKEFLWLQSAGMFKSKIYENSPEISNYMQEVGQKDVFCLTATDQAGNILWQTGNPYEGTEPYITHASEHILKTGDINGDGTDEILVLDDQDNLLVIEPVNGNVIRKVNLPDDSFSTLFYIRTGDGPKDFILLIGVMDRAYSPHPYANPWIIMNSDLEIVSCRDYKGAGHNVLIEDMNNDGKVEMLIGYQLINTSGEVLWTVDCWEAGDIDSLEQHADYIHAKHFNGDWLIAISGSDNQYLIDSSGKTLWVKRLPHPQACLIGYYRGEPRVFITNQREVMNSYTLDGSERWKGKLREHWPMGRPSLAYHDRPIHSSDPMEIIESTGAASTDLILYKEGGWPYLINFNGDIVKQLPYTPSTRKMDPAVGFRRINDIGLSYEAAVADIDNDGLAEILIYDRNHLWTYKL